MTQSPNENVSLFTPCIEAALRSDGLLLINREIYLLWYARPIGKMSNGA